MKKEKKLSLTLGLLAGITSLALLASTAGSLAWYAYSRTVEFSYVGTSVASSALLKIGLVDNGGYFSDEDLETYGLVKETAVEGSDTNSICFSNGRTGFSTAAIRHYLKKAGNAVDKLFPVTSNARALNDNTNIKLYRSSLDSHTNFDVLVEKNAYVSLPFAFKIIDDEAQYVAGKNVWLTDAIVQGEQEIDSAVRVHVAGASKFLMKPADSTNGTGYTKVGGVLDLDNDGYYDVTRSTGKEYCYGYFEETPTYSSSPYPEGTSAVDDVNGVGDPNNTPSSFLSRHLPGYYTANIADAKPLKANYYNFGAIKPSMHENGDYYIGDSGKVIASTSNGSKIGYATFTIYLEGWDYSVVDRNIGMSFNLELKFEIDRT